MKNIDVDLLEFVDLLGFSWMPIKFKFKSTGKGKPVACGPGAVSHSSAFLHNRNNVKQCIQTLVCFTKNKVKKGEKRLTIHSLGITSTKDIRELTISNLRGSIQLFYHVSWP